MGNKLKRKKEPTAEKLAAVRKKEIAEIAKWEKQKSRRKGNFYFWYLLMIITVVYITDEVATQIGTQMKTEIANDIFASFGERSIGFMDIIGYSTYVCMALALVYKPLADKYGRKIFLVLNTLGLAVGMFMMFLTNNMVLYAAATAVIAFFTPHDMQVVYIMETAPEKHRAKVFSVVKSIATLGVLLIPLLRRTLMTDVSRWRFVYLVPAVIGFAVSLFALLFARESDVFIDRRLEYLRMTDEEKMRIRSAQDVANAQGGLRASLKFVWQHKQLKWLYIAFGLYGLGFVMSNYYQVIMTYGYAGVSMADGTFSTLEQALNSAAVGPVTTALFMFPLASALLTCITGFLADAIGRKTTALITACVTVTSYLLFYIGSKFGWSPYIVGLLSGAMLGSYWATGDVISGLMLSESSPTNLRASILSSQVIAMAVGMGPAFIISVILLAVKGNGVAGIVCTCLTVPGLAASILALLLKTHETKGVDLDTVRGDEWD